jgi:hypothetical protein
MQYDFEGWAFRVLFWFDSFALWSGFLLPVEGRSRTSGYLAFNQVPEKEKTAHDPEPAHSQQRYPYDRAGPDRAFRVKLNKFAASGHNDL